MVFIKQHFSPITNKWNDCTAIIRSCRYEKHRSSESATGVSDRKALADVFYKNNLPQTVSLLSNRGKVKEMNVAEEGTIGKRCRGCNMSLSVKTIQGIEASQAGANINCEHCGHTMNWGDMQEPPYLVEVNRTEAHLIQNREAIKEQTWFHGTTVDNWAAEIAAVDVFIHAGTNHAALERLEISGAFSDAPQYVYELRIKPETKIDSNVYWDDNKFPEILDHRTASTINKSKIALYVNQWESPGSVSIIESFHQFEVVGMKEVASK